MSRGGGDARRRNDRWQMWHSVYSGAQVPWQIYMNIWTPPRLIHFRHHSFGNAAFKSRAAPIMSDVMLKRHESRGSPEGVPREEISIWPKSSLGITEEPLPCDSQRVCKWKNLYKSKDIYIKWKETYTNGKRLPKQQLYSDSDASNESHTTDLHTNVKRHIHEKRPIWMKRDLHECKETV